MIFALTSAAVLVSITLHEAGISEPTMACMRNKTLHLIRHAEGWHNTDELEAEAALKSGTATWNGLNLQDPKNLELRKSYGIAWTLLEQVEKHARTGSLRHHHRVQSQARKQRGPRR